MACSKHAKVMSDASHTKIRDLILQYKCDKTKVAPVFKELSDVLVKEGCAKQRLFLPHNVVAHEKNRDEQILSASGVQMRAVRLNKVGFCKATMEQGAWAFEDHPVTKRLAKVALKHYESDERFARYKETEVVAASVGASHCNHVLASIKDERPCSDPLLPTDVYDKNHWYQNEDCKSACETGVLWWTVRWEVEQEFPLLPHIFQSALNTAQHVAEGDDNRICVCTCSMNVMYTHMQNMMLLHTAHIRLTTGEGWAQILSKIQNEAQAQTVGKRTDWDQVMRAVLKTQPKCATDVPDMVEWYKKYGGGANKVFIPMISKMLDKHVDPTVQVSGSFFKALAGLKFAAEEKVPAHFVHAVLISHAAAREMVVDGYAKFYKVNEVDSLGVNGKRHKAAHEAQSHILRANQLAKDTGLPEHVVITPRFKLMDRLARLVLKYDPNKECKDVDPHFITFEAISSEFVSDLVRLAPGADLKGTTNYKSVETSSASSSNVANFTEYNSDGVVVAQAAHTLAAKGYTVGCTVQAAKGKADEQWLLKDIEADSGEVTLCRLNARDGTEGEPSTFSLGEFIKKFKVTKTKIEMLPNYPGNDAASHDDFKAFNFTCIAGTCVYELAQMYQETDFDIQVSPIKRVVSKRAFAAGALHLVPATNRILRAKDGKMPAVDEFTITFLDEPDAPKCLLVKPQGADYTSALWKLRIDYDRDKCNCHVKTVEGQYKTPIHKKGQLLKKVSVEVVNNFKEVSEGMELVLYKPAPVKAGASKKPVLAAVQSDVVPAKKQRKA